MFSKENYRLWLHKPSHTQRYECGDAMRKVLFIAIVRQNPIFI